MRVPTAARCGWPWSRGAPRGSGAWSYSGCTPSLLFHLGWCLVSGPPSLPYKMRKLGYISGSQHVGGLVRGSSIPLRRRAGTWAGHCSEHSPTRVRSLQELWVQPQHSHKGTHGVFTDTTASVDGPGTRSVAEQP